MTTTPPKPPAGGKRPTRHRVAAPLVAGALLGALTVALTGCSGVDDLLKHRVQGTFDTPAALAHAWSTPASEPAWVPADATRIRVIAATTGAGADETPAVVRVTTTAKLPVACTSITRSSTDPFAAAWAPKDIPDQVERCGNWAVVAVEGGYYGWTPLTPAERDQPAQHAG